MNLKVLSRTPKIAILFVLFLFGCAVPGRGPLVVTDRSSPDVRLSPEIQLLDVPIQKIRVAIDQDGRVHALALTSKPPELHHLIIGIEGVLKREVVTGSASYDHLDIAFDSSGSLHAIVDEDHFVLEDGVWRTLQKHHCIKFISGGEDLFCLSRVEGKDVGAAADVDWYFIAGAGYGGGGCCLIPLPHHPDKLVLARKTSEGWSKLALFDAETKFEMRYAAIAADNSGTLHVLYNSAEGGSLRAEQCAYARIEPMTPKKASQSKQSYSSDHEEAPRTFANVSGQVLVTRRNPSFLSCQDIAVDPETGTALITIMEGYGERFQSYSRIVESGKIGWNVLMYDFDGMIDVEPAGERRFLALGVWSDQGSPTKTWFIYYLEYHDGMWSAPVELGKNIHVGNVAFLSDLDRRAFALWTKKDGRPVGRWIER
jgi:hypothetical protein